MEQKNQADFSHRREVTFRINKIWSDYFRKQLTEILENGHTDRERLPYIFGVEGGYFNSTYRRMFVETLEKIVKEEGVDKVVDELVEYQVHYNKSPFIYDRMQALGYTLAYVKSSDLRFTVDKHEGKVLPLPYDINSDVELKFWTEEEIIVAVISQDEEWERTKVTQEITDNTLTSLIYNWLTLPQTVNKYYNLIPEMFKTMHKPPHDAVKFDSNLHTEVRIIKNRVDLLINDLSQVQDRKVIYYPASERSKTVRTYYSRILFKVIECTSLDGFVESLLLYKEKYWGSLDLDRTNVQKVIIAYLDIIAPMFPDMQGGGWETSVY